MQTRIERRVIYQTSAICRQEAELDKRRERRETQLTVIDGAKAPEYVFSWG
jgi:hypothetical protein